MPGNWPMNLFPIQHLFWGGFPKIHYQNGIIETDEIRENVIVPYKIENVIKYVVNELEIDVV